MAVDLFSLVMRMRTEGVAQATGELRGMEAQGIKTTSALHQGTIAMDRARAAALNGTKGFRDLSGAYANQDRVLADLSRRKADATDKIDKKTKATTSLWGSLKALGAVYAGMKILGFVNDTLKAAGALHEMAQKTGASVEMLSVLQFAGKQTDTSIAQITMGFRGMALSLGNLRDGQAKTVEAYGRLGLSTESFKGLNTDQTFLKIVQAMRGMPEGLEKSEVATRIFGRAGAELLPLMVDIADKGFARWRQETQAGGGLITDDMARKADAFGDAIARLKVSLGGLVKDILIPMLPFLQAFVDGLAAVVRNIRLLSTGGPAVLGFAAGKEVAKSKAEAADWDAGDTAFDGVASGGSSTTDPKAPPTPPSAADRAAAKAAAKAAAEERRRMLLGLLDAAAPDQLAGGGPLSFSGPRTDRIPLGGALTGGAFPKRESAADTEMQRRFMVMQEWAQRVKQEAAGVQRQFAQLGTNLGMTLANGFASAMAAGIQGKNIFKAFGTAVLSGLGSIFTQMGAELLAYGVIMLNLLPFLSNPFTSGPAAIAAGAALVALGTVLGGIATSSGGGSGGGKGGLTDTTTRITLTADGLGGRTAPRGKDQPVYEVIGAGHPRGARMFGEFQKAATRRNIG